MEPKHIEFFNHLYRSKFERLVNYAMRITDDRQLAEDSVQEMFLICLLKIEELINHPHPAGWAYKAVANICASEQRKTRRRQAILQTSGHVLVPDNSKIDNQPDEIFVEQISDDEWKLIRWRFVDQLSYEEIAVMLGISNEACRKRVERIKNKIKN